MNTAHSAAEFGHSTDSDWRVLSSLTSCWVAFQQWRRRGRLQAELCDLSDRGLMDIGIARGEIEYVTSIRGSEPRRGF
jgi:uncharacterized protein YjiS (DUF1127 family)